MIDWLVFDVLIYDFEGVLLVVSEFVLSVCEVLGLDILLYIVSIGC